GVDRMVLTEQLAVMDLVALGRSLLLPEDDLTLATVLKGPLIGLTEEQLFDLAYDRSGGLWAELARRAERDGALRAAYGILTALQARADYVRPYELYGELLGRGRGRDKLLARLGPEAADPIEEFLSLALAFEREQVPSLEGFLHWLEAGAQAVKRDMEHGGDTVRVMTVHGAKGLQAPVVFLPDTLQVPQAGRGLLWLEHAGGLALWPVRKSYDGAAAERARAAAAEAQDQEYRRLLYVAMTRAEDRLYVCGWNTRSKAPQACWYRLIEAALPAVAEEVRFDFTGEIDGGWAGPGLRLVTAQAAEPEEAPEAAIEPGPPAGLPPWAHEAAPPEPAPPRPLAPSRPAMDEPPVRSPLGSDDGLRFRRGRIVHRLLQSLPDLPAARRPEAAGRFLAGPVHALTAAQQAEILAETLAALDHPDFAGLFGPHSRAEVPIVGMIEGARGVEVVSGQIDRLVVTDKAVLVVDYKTNRPAPRTEAEVPALYLRQMAAYRAVLSGIYPDRPIESFLLWTEGPRIMHVSDALLAGHGP
ncbi:MAG: PD-(D/E)XK nuclease family protein, partial [Rhodospirillales bacterium]|nr:PD-(D/E)XK nuclease family protein [Rhodospirillales bacterium]